MATVRLKDAIYFLLVFISCIYLTRVFFGKPNSGGISSPMSISSFSIFSTKKDPEYSFSDMSYIPISGWKPKDTLCSFPTEDDLSSFIWSHRASIKDHDSNTNTNINKKNNNNHREEQSSSAVSTSAQALKDKGVGEDTVWDGSAAATKTLLDNGITNFDIDICYQTVAEAGTGTDTATGTEQSHGKFVVAHPTVLQEFMEITSKDKDKDKAEQEQGQLQTLQAFLKQVHSHDRVQRLLNADSYIPGSSSTKKHVFITIEPKFLLTTTSTVDSSWSLLDELISILNSSEFNRRHTAVIVNNEDDLTVLERTLLLYRNFNAQHANDNGMVGIGGARSSVSSSGNGNGHSHSLLLSLGADLGDMYDLTYAASIRFRPLQSQAQSSSSLSASTVRPFQWNSSPNWFQKHVLHSSTATSQRQEQEQGLGLGRAHSYHSEISDIFYGSVDHNRVGKMEVEHMNEEISVCDDCCTPIQHLATSRKIQQILMPDMAVLEVGTKQAKLNAKAQGNQHTEKICNRIGSTVIPWIVDSPGPMWALLDRNYDGIVTNRPIFMLNALKERYRRKCHVNGKGHGDGDA